LRNFPMQGNGAEMMRLAACMLTESGITVCAPVHDAFLIEADADEIEGVVEQTQCIMREAGEIVFAGFQLRTDAKIIRHPDRYLDPRGERFWQTVQTLLAEANAAAEPLSECHTYPCHSDRGTSVTTTDPVQSFLSLEESFIPI